MSLIPEPRQNDYSLNSINPTSAAQTPANQSRTDLSASAPTWQKREWNHNLPNRLQPIHFTLDPSGTVLAVNPSGAASLGYLTDALVGQSIDQITHAADRDLLRGCFHVLPYSTDVRNILIHLLSHDGQYVRVNATVQTLQGEATSWVLLTCTAIAQQNAHNPDLLPSPDRSTSTAVFPVGIFFADAQGEFLYASDRYCKIAGLSRASVQGTGWITSLHPEDRHRVIAEWAQAIQTGSPFKSEYRLQPTCETSVWVLGQAIAERDPGGTIIGYVGTITDISDRKQVEEVLWQRAEREKLMRVMTQHIRQSLDLKRMLHTTVTEVRQLLQTDRVLIYRVLNNDTGSVLTEALTHSYSSTLGQQIPSDRFLPEGHAHYQQGQIRVIDDIEHNLVPDLVNCLQPLGVRSMVIVPILEHDALWGLLIAHHCQTVRHWQDWEIDLLSQIGAQVEIAVQQAEFYQQVQRLNADLERQIQVRTAQLQLAFDFEATLKRITDKVRDSLDEDQILQAAVQELVLAMGVSCCNAALYDLDNNTSTIRYEYTTTVSPSQGRVAQLSAYPEIYGQLFQGQSFQFCSVVPNPRRGHVAMLSSPIFDDQGVIGDLWLINHKFYAFSEQDIRLVEQVANQCAIAIRQARLYQTSQAQVKELEKLNRLKDDFLSTVSHELRTPMSNMKLAIQMLEMVLFNQRQAHPLDATGKQPAPAAIASAPSMGSAGSDKVLTDPINSQRAFQYFQILRQECQREITLINDLLDLSRLESHREDQQVLSANLSDWMQRLAEPFIERSHQYQQQFHLDLSDENLTLTTNWSALERVLTELWNNACKYTPAGEQIVTTAIADSQSVCIQVSNSGIEIPASEYARVFEKFYRIPNHNPWQHGGTGLGLALVKKLVEQLHGTIRLSSASGWTKFNVQIPIH